MNNFDIKDLQARIETRNLEPIRAFVSVTERITEKDGKRVFVMSDEVKDRHGTVVRLGSGADISQYNTNPIVLWMHESSKGFFDMKSYDPDNVLGFGEAYFEDGKLKNRITFESLETTGNQLADTVVRKIDFGSLRAGSIGFVPIAGSYGKKEMLEDEETFYIREWTLLEFSIVTIPSNPNALIENAYDRKTQELEEELDKHINEVITQSEESPLSRNKAARAKRILTLINLKK